MRRDLCDLSKTLKEVNLNRITPKNVHRWHRPGGFHCGFQVIESIIESFRLEKTFKIIKSSFGLHLSNSCWVKFCEFNALKGRPAGWAVLYSVKVLLEERHFKASPISYRAAL